MHINVASLGLNGDDADGRNLSTRFWLQLVKYW